MKRWVRSLVHSETGNSFGESKTRRTIVPSRWSYLRGPPVPRPDRDGLRNVSNPVRSFRCRTRWPGRIRDWPSRSTLQMRPYSWEDVVWFLVENQGSQIPNLFLVWSQDKPWPTRTRSSLDRMRRSLDGVVRDVRKHRKERSKSRFVSGGPEVDTL